jgi:septum formation protein
MTTPHPNFRPELILASGSPYRKELLQRLNYNFTSVSPDIDESLRSGESPGSLALRLARAKAAKVAQLHPAATVIGSDQVAALDEKILGKPGSHVTAAQQLAACSGKSVVFHTAVCVRQEDAQFEETHTDISTVHFRELSGKEIDAYLRADKPWDCAGSFKSEGLGAALFISIRNEDPAAIIGLPMIWLTNSLRRAGLPILA